MELIFTLITITTFAFVVLVVAFPATCSSRWDSILIYTLYFLGCITVVLGFVGAIGLISGLL